MPNLLQQSTSTTIASWPTLVRHHRRPCAPLAAFNPDPVVRRVPVDTAAPVVTPLPQASTTTRDLTDPVPAFAPVPIVPNYRVSLWDAMKFAGPAPEVVNSRAAMLGFVIGAVTEAQTGQTLMQQAASPSIPAVLLLLLTVYASLVPILKGAKFEAFGPFSPRSELVNGRAAMLGIAALLYIEHKAGVPFF